jgi:starch synthase
MKIAIAAAEMVPFVKVGGLADVTGALSKELARLGHEVRVFLPRPPGLTPERFPGLSIRKAGEVAVHFPDGTERADLELATTGEPGLEIVLVHHDGYYDRPNPYVDPKTGTDWPDNARRFVFFSKAIIEGFRALGWFPDALHLNDYQTGLVPILLREVHVAEEKLRRVGVLYAIHNMGYQGIFPPEVLAEIGHDTEKRFFYPTGPLEFYGKVNFMKAAILYADMITTVSERYALEIQESEEFGFGLEGVLSTRARDVHGILNGIDDEIWDPATDPLIPHNYGPTDLGPKRENKARLLHAMELPEEDLDTPVIGVISRLVDQKGFDLLEEAAGELLEKKLKLVVLGNGLPKYEKLMRELRSRHPKKFAVSLTFNDPLAHLIEAGSDLFLMPSRYEPCGLNQMYSLRYGTIPIVRATGGLADTVHEYDQASGRGNGFVFGPYTAAAMCEAIDRALAAYGRTRSWKKLVSQVMRIDHSWKRAALKYVAAYQKVAAIRR